MIFRDLITYIEWDILSSFGEHYNLLDCQLLLVEQFPSGIYIDPDQVKNEEEFGGPEVRSKFTGDTKVVLNGGFLFCCLPL